MEKALHLSNLAIEYDCMVLCISELGHRRTIPGWTCIASTDTFTQSGIFVRNGFKATKLEHSALSIHCARIAGECITFNTTGLTQVIVIHTYIPPEVSYTDRRHYGANISRFAASYPSHAIMLTGDLNTRSVLFDPNEDPTRHSYLDESLNQLPWNVITDGSPTRLDHCLDITLVNDTGLRHIIHWQALNEAISDHLPCLTSSSLKVWHNTKGLHQKPFQITNMTKTIDNVVDWINKRSQRQDPLTLEDI